MSQGLGSFEPTLKSILFLPPWVFERSCKHGAAWKQNTLVKLGSRTKSQKTMNSLQSDNFSDPELSPCDQSKRQDEKRVEPHRACRFTSVLKLSLRTCAIRFVFSVAFCRRVILLFFFCLMAVRIYVIRRIAYAWLCINLVPRVLRFYLLHLPLLFSLTVLWLSTSISSQE